MMFLILSTTVSALWAQSDVRCRAEAEQYVDVGYTQPARFQSLAPDGSLIFYVRTNELGGDAAYEVVVSAADCSLKSRRLLWSE